MKHVVFNRHYLSAMRVLSRLFDHSMEGFKNWEFMTTHCWGEKAAGDWILEIHDSPSQLRSQKVPGMEQLFIGLQLSIAFLPIILLIAFLMN